MLFSCDISRGIDDSVRLQIKQLLLTIEGHGKKPLIVCHPNYEQIIRSEFPSTKIFADSSGIVLKNTDMIYITANSVGHLIHL